MLVNYGLRADKDNLESIIRFLKRIDGAGDDIPGSKISPDGIDNDSYVRSTGFQLPSQEFNANDSPKSPADTGGFAHRRGHTRSGMDYASFGMTIARPL